MGLPGWFKTTNTTIKANDGIIPLAIDEFGRISAWVKKFNQHNETGSGFVSFRNWAYSVTPSPQELELLYQVAVYGLK